MSGTVLAREPEVDLRQRPKPRALKCLSRKRLALAGAALVLLGAAGWYGDAWWTTGRFIESTDDAYVGGNITALAPHVSGFVSEVLVTDNQRVHAGQVLIRLDRRDFEAALDHASAAVGARAASLERLRAQYLLQQSTIRQQEADLTAKAAQLTFATQDATRYDKLGPTSSKWQH